MGLRWTRASMLLLSPALALPCCGQVAPVATPPRWPDLELTRHEAASGSPYISMDSWIYPAVQRLAALGYADTAFAGLRPWTRLSVANMLAETSDRISDGASSDADNEAVGIYLALARELEPDVERSADEGRSANIEQIYTRVLGIGGEPLRDSFHVGSTLVNDYGRPYASGFNNVTGVSATATARRFSLNFRGEYQRTSSSDGYSQAVAQILSRNDQVPYGPPQDTIPLGPVASADTFRVIAADAAVHLWGHEVSFGKTDEWMGPAKGGSFAWSDNAESIYALRINHVDPFRIPVISHFTGPWRYDFLVGSLKGHTRPNDPWIHAEKISFKPTINLEFGFERTVIWGGKGHAPITIHSFLRSFFSFSSPSAADKQSRNDPGARFGSFDVSYRLPCLRKWLTFYTDAEAHDDVSPLDAPRRAAYRPGLYLSHFPGVNKLDFRIEAVSTDPGVHPSKGGYFMYWEYEQPQGYTNKGQILGDWIGRESKGGQVWLTYHLSPAEWVQVAYRNAKADKDFIPGGTTQNDYTVQVVKRLARDIEVNAWLQVEGWKAPLIRPGLQRDTSAAVQFTWYVPRSAR